jgi:hypothetical protein
MNQLTACKNIYCLCKKKQISTSTSIENKKFNSNTSNISNKLRQAQIISSSLGGKPVILN